jgi:hypothetical protein
VSYAVDRQAVAKARCGCAAIAGCDEKAMLLVNCTGLNLARNICAILNHYLPVGPNARFFDRAHFFDLVNFLQSALVFRRWRWHSTPAHLRAIRAKRPEIGAFMHIKTLAAALALSTFAAPAFAEDLVFTLINNSTQPLANLFVSLPEAAEWGDDILGVETLGVGETGTVTLAGGKEICKFDLQFVMENEAMIEGTADLCETNTFTLTD